MSLKGKPSIFKRILSTFSFKLKDLLIKISWTNLSLKEEVKENELLFEVLIFLDIRSSKVL